MHARVTTITGGSPERVEQSIERYREQVVPWIKENGGRGAILLVDREAGRGLAISLWDDAEVMRGTEDASLQMRRDAAEEIGTTAEPQAERYEVAVFEA